LRCDDDVVHTGGLKFHRFEVENVVQFEGNRVEHCSQWDFARFYILPLFLNKVIRSKVTLFFTPYPLFQWYLQSNENLFYFNENKIMKISLFY